MHRIPTLLATAAALGVLAAPASALAAGSTVTAGPLKVKGYDVTLTATDNGAADSFGVMAMKRSGQSTQLHQWSFSTGVAVKIKGSKATIKGKLGAYGSINAKVAAGRKATGTVPPGCKGTPGSARTGTLRGKTKIALDRTFFTTLAPKTLKAQILTGGKLDCGSGGGQQSSGLMLMSSVDGADGQLMVNVVKAGGTVTQQVMRSDAPAATAPASVMHLITAQTGGSGLDAASDLSTASAPGVSPFLTGTLSFAGEGMGTMAAGSVSGSFAAKFDSIGTQTLPDGNDAMLMQR
ncbi:MAG TPA: hypothetical protein VFT50_16120 [Baekduia sp.]|nr:hypothetical protein [Baekduia sp.]